MLDSVEIIELNEIGESIATIYQTNFSFMLPRTLHSSFNIFNLQDESGIVIVHTSNRKNGNHDDKDLNRAFWANRDSQQVTFEAVMTDLVNEPTYLPATEKACLTKRRG